MRIDQVVSPVPLGTARRQSYMPPAFQRFNQGSIGVTSDAASRQSDVGQGNGYVLLTRGAPPAGSGGQIYKGRACFAMTSNTNTGYTLTGGAMFIQTQRSAGNVPIIGNVDWAVWEWSAILAFDAITGAMNANGQIGLQVGSGNWNEIGFGTAPTQSGWIFGPTNTGVLAVTVRTTDGGALTTVPITATPTQTEFHRYAIRLVSASGAAEAVTKFLVDGTVVGSISWGAGTILPTQVNTFVAPRLGFTPSITNTNYAAATNRMYIADNSCQVIAAPTEDALA